MKVFLFAFLTVMCLVISGSTKAQGGEVIFNPAYEPCLTSASRDQDRLEIVQNQKMLDTQSRRAYTPGRAIEHILFDWPVRQAAGFNFASTWAVSSYVDHNPTIDQLQDWNCGERSYDTPNGYNHPGLDIYTWPFWWKQMDDNQTEVIAGQSGQIIFKKDGQFDRNCAYIVEQWNGVYVEHSDGSIALYGHLKDRSLNSKNVGDMVAQGEYLGVVGSSGYSLSPHLHFEVYDAAFKLIDPYAGPCNTLNDTSWWNDQKEYNNPRINTLLTHSAPPEFFFNDCNVSEEPNLRDLFSPGDSVIVAAYLADQTAGTTASYEVRDPNGVITDSWTQTFEESFFSSYWYWTTVTNDTQGIWEFKATYNGQTEIKQFTVGATNPLKIKVYPNPVRSILKIASREVLKGIVIKDLEGRTVLSTEGTSGLVNTLDVSAIKRGFYFLKATSLETGKSSTVRVIKR